MQPSKRRKVLFKLKYSTATFVKTPSSIVPEKATSIVPEIIAFLK